MKKLILVPYLLLVAAICHSLITETMQDKQEKSLQ